MEDKENSTNYTYLYHVVVGPSVGAKPIISMEPTDTWPGPSAECVGELLVSTT